MTAPVLAIEGLKTHIHLKRGVVRAVDGVDLTVGAGETLGLVGESGSGKSMTGLSILRLLPKGAGKIVAGSIRLDGEELTTLPEKVLARDVRGRRVAMIAQDPMTSLNPVFSIGDQVSGPFRYHGGLPRQEARAAAVDVLQRVRIPSPEMRLGDYPHQFSGGQRQRIVTAMAIGRGPRLLIADEPTTALDVTIQAQMIALLRRLQQESGAGIILITHDLGVAASLCNRIAVMYAGRIVETGPVREVFRNPAHPYTRALLAAIPKLGSRGRRLVAIPGQPPSLIDPPAGCRFAARCPLKVAACEAYPQTSAVGPDHSVACWRAGEAA
ncbi:MAG: ABC transporter ATP-binding protein [Phreatobacter sp.]|uniref:ABC transporter ATP-binding protein n=1 Tax=Phreatobacter sp. TaxID=1966341 RepID=UPI001A56CF28|nr:ABC transporter ATP-binding protein [Phreatobacter sp.]MBL8569480.1 ABC transporter ATP-binding protein [Phreatobacter sp.]